MKVLAVLLLCGVVAAHDEFNQHKMYKAWAGMKAMESCYGKENMKIHTTELKQAIAHCHQQDAPELNLPPFRSPYRFINTLMSSADEKEQQQIMFIHKMMQEMSDNSPHQYNHNSNNYFNSNSWMDNMFKKMAIRTAMKKMAGEYMNNMNKNNYHNDMSYGSSFMNTDNYDNYNYNSMSNANDNTNYNVDKMMDQFFEDKLKANMMKYKMQQSHGSSADKFRTINPFANKNSYREKMSALLQRHKRQAKPAGGSAITLPESLDLGDRLADKLKQEQEQIKSSVGNMTCVMRKMGVLNDQNEVDINTQKRHFKKYKFESQWLQDRIEDDMELCVKMANALPSEAQQEYNYPGYANLSKLMAHNKCCQETTLRTCVFYDVKKKLETNFGSLEKILEQTQMTENQLLPLVLNLLHGEEMEYFMF